MDNRHPPPLRPYPPSPLLDDRSFTANPALDPAVCWQAIYSRDRRFDGRFFAGVITTGVYCRPICPVPLTKPANVHWYPTAASAEAAGFRPCRRCRPHTSPGTPAWLGTSAVVSRALKLITEGALDRGDIEELAARVGLGGRQLRRLFVQHLGASPIKIAGTRRVHFARNLLEQTDLPITNIAAYSGFASIRQFNHAMRAAFAAPPSQLRQSGRTPKALLSQGGITVQLAYRPPFAWSSLINFLGQRATPGVELVTDDCYRRTSAFDDGPGHVEVRPDPKEPLLHVRVRLPNYAHLMLVVERVRQIFDLGADPLQITGHLAQDPRLAPMLEARPGLRVPGVWDVFELAVRAVLGQQLTYVDPKSVIARLVKTYGRPLRSPPHPGLTHLFPAAAILAGANLSSIGLPPARAATLQALARTAAAGNLSGFPYRSLEELIERLCTIHGLGQRRANYIALRAFGEPDAFPSDDRGLRMAHAGARSAISAAELLNIAEAWRPWRAYAAMHLWAATAR
jgi:AraC family transcriptional regulator, regulatory protein of adaptative response / DNA-3-methyladenine glycosylase II